jgi:hypothetical protein
MLAVLVIAADEGYRRVDVDVERRIAALRKVDCRSAVFRYGGYGVLKLFVVAYKYRLAVGIDCVNAFGSDVDVVVENLLIRLS